MYIDLVPLLYLLLWFFSGFISFSWYKFCVYKSCPIHLRRYSYSDKEKRKEAEDLFVSLFLGPILLLYVVIVLFIAKEEPRVYPKLGLKFW